MAMPGDVRISRESDDCPCQYDECSDVATHEYCTDVDSMGGDWLPLCEKHLEQFKEDVANAQAICDGECEWCGAKNVQTTPFRDWQEGAQGPLYDVCETCRGKSIDEANQLANNVPEGDDDDGSEAYAEMPELDEEELRQTYEDVEDMFEDEKHYRLTDLTMSVYQGSGTGNGKLREYINAAIAAGNDLSPTQHMNMSGPVKVDQVIGFTFYWQGIPTLNVAWFANGEALYSSMEMDRWYTYPVEHLVQVVNKLAALGYPVKDLSYEQTWHLVE